MKKMQISQEKQLEEERKIGKLKSRLGKANFNWKTVIKQVHLLISMFYLNIILEIILKTK